MMERAVAIKKLGKLLGKAAGYRIDREAPNREERAEALARCKEFADAKQKAEAAMIARRHEILEADEQYRTLRGLYEEMKKSHNEAFGLTHRFRFTVGTTSELFFHVKAQGDSWEDIFEILERKAAS